MRTDALLVTLALATSPYKPIVIAPGSSIPEDSEIVGFVHSATKFVSARGGSANSNAVTIVLGDEDQTAQDILATGKAVVTGGEGAQNPSTVEPADLALTLISDDIALDFSHVVSHSAGCPRCWKVADVRHDRVSPRLSFRGSQCSLLPLYPPSRRSKTLSTPSTILRLRTVSVSPSSPSRLQRPSTSLLFQTNLPPKKSNLSSRLDLHLPLLSSSHLLPPSPLPSTLSSYKK